MLRTWLVTAAWTVSALGVCGSLSPLHAAPQAAGSGPAIVRQPPRDRAMPEKTGTAVIRGRITALDSGRPLRRVRVAVNAPEIQETRSVSTGSDGRFEIANLPAGSYSVSAQRSGYLRLGYGQKRPGDPAGRLELADRQVVSDVDFALPRMSVISGRVFDEVGDPISGVTVMAQQMRFFEGRRKLVPLGGMVQTDDTGGFRLLNLEPGEYVVVAHARETWEGDGTPKETLAFLPTYFPSTPTATAAQRVKVATGQEAGGTDIALLPGRVARVTGTAHSSTGAPLVGQSVSLGQSFRSPSGFMASMGMEGTKVAADGTFTLKNVPAGEFSLSVRVPAMGDAPAESASLTITVSGADIDGVALTTSAGAEISGRLVFENNVAPPQPAPQFRVIARPVVRESAMNAPFSPDNGRARTDWTFTLTGLTGANRLSVATLPPGWAIRSIDAAGRDLTDAPIEFTSGEKIGDVTVTLTNRFPTLTGSTTDRRTVPRDAMVIVFAEDAAKWGEDSRLVRTVRSDKGGSFRLSAMPPGDYLAVALDYVVDGDWHDPQFLESLRSGAVRVTLKEGDTATVALQVKVPS
jgi:hypothetical protein